MTNKIKFRPFIVSLLLKKFVLYKTIIEKMTKIILDIQNKIFINALSQVVLLKTDGNILVIIQGVSIIFVLNLKNKIKKIKKTNNEIVKIKYDICLQKKLSIFLFNFLPKLEVR